MLGREVADAILLLVECPDAGARFHRATQPGVRKLLLRRTQHYLYYRVDDERRMIRVLTLWHTARGHDPVM